SILSLGALLAPLLEEIFFRELLPGSVGRSPHFAGHLGSAVLFAVLHLPVDGWQFLYYLMAAATLSLLRILSGNLLWPIAVHSAANIASLWIMQ
ncbi:MAG: CPBP family intramembrane metalloprotease domain-containing protein, partial [Spirochaetae bacterium HGW-Spirochaetae-10]